MKRKKELIARRAELLTAEREHLERLKTEELGLDGEEETAYNERRGQIEALDSQIAALEKTEKEIAARAAQSRPAVEVRERVLDKPWLNFGEQLQAIVRAGTPAGQGVAGLPGGYTDPRLLEQTLASGASEAIPGDGGFLVGEEHLTEIMRMAHNVGVLAPRCRSIPVGANFNRISLPLVNETSRATGSRWGGVRVYRVAEAGTVTPSKPAYDRMNIELEKLMGIYYATDELIQDASALGAIASQAFAEEFAFVLDDEILRGNGAGQCLGILNGGALVSVAKETGQAAATIVYENVVKMFNRMYPRSMANAVWFINVDVMPQLQTMALVVGTGGVPVYLPPGGATASPYGTLFSRPVVPIEHCETLGTVGDIIFADLSQYLLIRKGGLTGAQSMHVRFLYEEQTFRWSMRVNGQPAWRTALTPYKGSNTQSPFVVLATRS